MWLHKAGRLTATATLALPGRTPFLLCIPDETSSWPVSRLNATLPSQTCHVGCCTLPKSGKDDNQVVFDLAKDMLCNHPTAWRSPVKYRR
jgi:hypothetical protein